MASSSIQVIDRSLDIIDLLAIAEHGMSIAEISAATQLPKSTVHRILSTLVERQYIEKDESTSVYCLGYRFLEISSLFLNKINLKTEALPIMHELSSYFNSIVYLGVMEGTEVVYLEKVDPFSSLRLYAQIGKREPIYCTALGKVLTAALPEDQFESLSRRLSFIPFTSYTVRNLDEFSSEVRKVKERGYATDIGEHTQGSCCVAVPIYDYTRQVMAAMSISGAGLFQNHSEAELAEKLKEAGAELSRRMGYTSPR